MHEIKTEIHNFSVIFPAQRWLPESRMTTTFIPMGGNLYRLNEGFLCGPISFGDVIEALPTDQKDVVLYQRRVKRAGLKRVCYIMPRDMAEKPGFAELMKGIKDLGGFAAVDFKGDFLLLLSKTCNLDVALARTRLAGTPEPTVQQRCRR